MAGTTGDGSAADGASAAPVTRAAVEAAAARIAGHVRVTPVLLPGPHAARAHAFKLELHQRTGTFKARGAFANLLAAAEAGHLDPVRGIAIASGGNAGLANADAAHALGVPATVFVAENASAVKVARLRALGATVVVGGAAYPDAYAAAVRFVSETGAFHCHAYDQPEVAAGAGTLALELTDQVPGGFDTVLVAVGGGGLVAGVAGALAGTARVVGVEPEAAPTLHAALAVGAPVDVAASGIAVDSLGARRVGSIAFATARATGVTSVLVPDDAIVAARRALWDGWRIAVEPGAAAAYAALHGGAYLPASDERVVVVLCGANTDPATLA
ncbi:MAG: serine/threonine dehydratase [Chloroflexota bacterium]